jgi:putative peptide zinc metalloprotease protein
VTRIIKTPRNKPMSRPRLAASFLIVAALAAAALAIPLPLHVYAPFLIEPYQVVHVYSSVPGTIAELLARPGAKVSRADLMLRLVDREKERQYQELRTQYRVAEVEVDKQRTLGHSARLAVARGQLQSIAAQLKDYESQLDQLRVVAPIDGTVVTPPRTAEPKQSADAFELHRWYGTPLDEQNLGSLIETRTHVCSVAPNARYQAVLLVDQTDRGDLKLDQNVEIKFDHLPLQVFEGKIAAIAERHTDFAPGTLSNKANGELATVTDKEGRERLTSVAYEATVLLDEQSGRLCAGMRGRSRFLVGHRSTWEWVSRWYRQTFNFRL